MLWPHGGRRRRQRTGSLTRRSLDLSFNNIRHVPSLPSLTKVNVMYLVQNKIAKVDEGSLDWAKDTMTSIELGGNRLRVSGSRKGAR
jgi:protein phosphatase 1 regulatory subunit 7